MPALGISGKGIAAAMIAAALVSVYIFFCYRLQGGGLYVT